MPRTFDHTDAMQMLYEIEDLTRQYENLTGRHAKSDMEVRDRLQDHRDMGTLLNSLSVSGAMSHLYEAGERVSIYGSDDHIQEAMYHNFHDDVRDAMERIGILQDETDDDLYEEEG